MSSKKGSYIRLKTFMIRTARKKIQGGGASVRSTNINITSRSATRRFTCVWNDWLYECFHLRSALSKHYFYYSFFCCLSKYYLFQSALLIQMLLDRCETFSLEESTQKQSQLKTIESSSGIDTWFFTCSKPHCRGWWNVACHGTREDSLTWICLVFFSLHVQFSLIAYSIITIPNRALTSFKAGTLRVYFENLLTKFELRELIVDRWSFDNY